MKNFREYIEDTMLNESTIPSELSKIKQIVDKAQKAWTSGNKAAYNEFLQAIWSSNDTIKMTKHVKKAESLQESTLKEEYVVTVQIRDALKANDLARDLFRGSYENDGSDSFIFGNEEDYEDFLDTLAGHGIEAK